MFFPPLQPITPVQSCVSGDVSIDPSAAISPGVLLQADPDCRIVIAAGVCIGMGSILHAHGGDIVVEQGAIIGAGVLAIGKVKIGANACVGSLTTLFNSDVQQSSALAAGSVIGDRSRQIVLDERPVSTPESIPAPPASDLGRNSNAAPPASDSGRNSNAAPPPVAPAPSVNNSVMQSSIDAAIARIASANKPFSPANLNTYTPPNLSNSTTSPAATPQPSPTNSSTDPPAETPQSSQTNSTPIYGQEHLNRLRGTLFPHSKALNAPLQTPPPEENNSK